MAEKTLQLEKPPLLEVAIQFNLDAGPEKRPWDISVAQSFIKQFEQSFPYVEISTADQIRIERRSPVDKPQKISGRTILERVRARNSEGSRWVQVGDDLFVFNLVRHGGIYPGFRQVRDEALAKLDLYAEHFRPVCVRSIILTYIDLVEIPRPAKQVLKLEEYFNLRIELPDEPFGSIGQFFLAFQLPRTPQTDQLGVTFRTVPVAPDSDVYRFVMQWQTDCENVKTLDRQEIVRRLDAANARVVTCFMASFTEKGLALFGRRK